MAENKTKANSQDVVTFLSNVENPDRREDALSLLTLMKEATGVEGVMWGSAIVGFGSYHYKYESGREGDTMIVGFSPRKQNMTLYLKGDFAHDSHLAPLLEKLGKHKLGGGCLYINKLSDVDQDVLRQIVKQSFEKTH
jgi:hypothetical protein